MNDDTEAPHRRPSAHFSTTSPPTKATSLGSCARSDTSGSARERSNNRSTGGTTWCVTTRCAKGRRASTSAIPAVWATGSACSTLKAGGLTTATHLLAMKRASGVEESVHNPRFRYEVERWMPLKASGTELRVVDQGLEIRPPEQPAQAMTVRGLLHGRPPVVETGGTYLYAVPQSDRDEHSSTPKTVFTLADCSASSRQPACDASTTSGDASSVNDPPGS